MDNFAINSNFENSKFNNAISEFNKSFDKSFKTSMNAADSASKFSEVFNSIGNKPLSGGISVDTNKNKTISPVEKTVNDIGNGFISSLNDLNDIQRKAENDFETFASGGDISVHDVMISAQKSSLSMQMALQIRNRLISAYNDFKSMSI